MGEQRDFTSFEGKEGRRDKAARWIAQEAERAGRRAANGICAGDAGNAHEAVGEGGAQETQGFCDPVLRARLLQKLQLGGFLVDGVLRNPTLLSPPRHDTAGSWNRRTRAAVRTDDKTPRPQADNPSSGPLPLPDVPAQAMPIPVLNPVPGKVAASTPAAGQASGAHATCRMLQISDAFSGVELSEHLDGARESAAWAIVSSLLQETMSDQMQPTGQHGDMTREAILLLDALLDLCLSQGARLASHHAAVRACRDYFSHDESGVWTEPESDK